MNSIYQLPLKIDRNEVLRYLSFSHTRTQLDNQTAALIENGIANAEKLISPQGLALTLETNANTLKPLLNDVALILGSPSLTSMLVNTDYTSLLAVTLGHKLDAAIDELFREGKYAQAVILDSIGSDAVEQASGALQEIIGSGFEPPLCPTQRVSPGYGDISLSKQSVILPMLNAQSLNIDLTSAHILRPRKTVTAIVGWSAQFLAPGGTEGTKCGYCPRVKCRFRLINTSEEAVK